MTPVTQAALAGSWSTCALRIRHVPRHSGLTKYSVSGTGLTAFAAARSPSASARNAAGGKCTMRTGRAERGPALAEVTV